MRLSEGAAAAEARKQIRVKRDMLGTFFIQLLATKEIIFIPLIVINRVIL